MAGDWIKMRPSLLTHPKVSGITRILEVDLKVGKALSNGFSGCMSEIVKRNVMRNVTVTSLLIIWGAANEHTNDGVFYNADLSDIDDMVGIPGFGFAMVSVGWAEYDEENSTVKLPNFSEYNTCGKDRAAENNAERQRRYREKKKGESNVTHNVTQDVTNNDREEKRREDIKHTSDKPDDMPGFAKFWESWPRSDRKVAKAECLKRWKARGLEKDAEAIINHLLQAKETKKWRDGFDPAPLTYINQKHWLDGDAGPALKPWEQ